jgi:hypothetical protein
MATECGPFEVCSTDNATGCSSAFASSIRFGVHASEDYYIRISARDGGESRLLSPLCFLSIARRRGATAHRARGYQLRQ